MSSKDDGRQGIAKHGQPNTILEYAISFITGFYNVLNTCRPVLSVNRPDRLRCPAKITEGIDKNRSSNTKQSVIFFKLVSNITIIIQ